MDNEERNGCFVGDSNQGLAIPRTLGSVSGLCLPRGGYSGNHDPAREFPKVIYVKIVSRVPYRTELRVLGIEEIRVPPILRPSKSS